MYCLALSGCSLAKQPTTPLADLCIDHSNIFLFLLFHFIVRFEQRQRCLADIWLPRSLHYRMRGKKEEMEGGRGASLPPVICISRSGSTPNPPSASNQKDSRGGGERETNNTLQQCAPYAWQCQTNLVMTKKRLLVCRCWENCASSFG